MSVLRANVAFAKRIFADRLGNPYVYGGNWDPHDTSVGTDCSGLVIDILDACVNGTRMAWSRHGMSTESWRPIEVGETGPFGTITVASPADFPSDAVVKVALHHGPGGGANSHMWCECDGVRMESNGDDGAVTGNQAMSVNDTSYANDWAYLPGPIVDTPTVLTVPLTRNANGTWTSPSPAWAHLIMRESGGNPTIIQGADVIDVNTGGNEAEGLFQITPATWRAHNGVEFAATPRLATPQQQAIVAARIFTANPSGSDWGAGLAGRENAAELAAGLVPTSTPTGEGFLMALTDAEQRELLDLARQIAAYRRDSRSPLRHLGEHNVDTATGLAINTDGNVHVLLVERLAKLGDPDALALLREVANADPAKYPDRRHDAQLAQAILNEIAGVGTADTAPPSGQTPGTIPTPIPTPAPQPITVPPPPPPVPPSPPSVPPGGGVASNVSGLESDVSALRQVLADLTTQIRS